MRHRGVLKVVAAVAAAVLGLLAFAGPARSTQAFDDVDGNEFFGPAVDWMETQGLTTGVGGTEAEPSPFYEPFAPVDRAQLATFMWRMAGSPEPTLADDGFTDTEDDAYYTKAVRWLRQQGYTTGVGGTPQQPGTTFEPHSPVDRAQAITLLWRYGGQPGPYGPHGFTDVDPGPPPTYFEAALRWAKAEGITTGYGGSDADPSDVFEPFITLTRGEMAVLVWRYAGFPAPNEPGCLAEGEWPCEDETPPTQPPTTTTTPTTEAPIPDEVTITSPTEADPAYAPEGGSFEVVFDTNVVDDYVIELDVAEADTGETVVGENTVQVDLPGGTAPEAYDLTVTVGDDTDTETNAVIVVPADSVVNLDTGDVYDTMPEAIAAVETMDDHTLQVFGSHADGVVVVSKSVTLLTDEATLAGSFHVTADDVTIDGFDISEIVTVLGEEVGIYLDGVENVEIRDNTITGDDDSVLPQRGILATAGTAFGLIQGNTLSDLTTGISLQGEVTLVITENIISDSTAGISSDTAGDADVQVTGNTFTDNEEGIGLGGPGVEIESNTFLLTGTPDGEVYVTDWVGTYDLNTILDDNNNTFDPVAEVDDSGPQARIVPS